MRIDYIKELRRMVSGRDVCEMYGVPLNANNKTHCLFHSEKTASMQVYDGEKGFYCFGCGARGDALDIVQKLFDLTVEEAARKINNDFALHLPIGEKLSAARQREVGRMMYDQRKKRQAKEKERQQMQDDYYLALDTFTLCQRIIKDFAPAAPEDEPHPMFVWACNNIARAEYELEVQETRRWIYDNRGRAMDGRGFLDSQAV